MNTSSVIHIISGPAGAGKTTLCNELLARHQDKLERIITTTTRAKREGEIEGFHYYFKSHEEFEKWAENGEFIEYAAVHTNLYGSTEWELQRILSLNKSPIYNVDIQGMVHLKSELHRRGYKVITYFLDAPLDILKERLRGRWTEDAHAFEVRLANALIEKEQAPLYDHQIENIDLEKAIQDLSEKMGLLI